MSEFMTLANKHNNLNYCKFFGKVAYFIEISIIFKCLHAYLIANISKFVSNEYLQLLTNSSVTCRYYPSIFFY